MKTLLPLPFLLLAFTLYSQPGQLDPLFGINGMTITHFNGYSAEANSMALQSDGKIVLAGIGTTDNDQDIIASRYLLDGQLDETFADNGQFTFSISSFRDRCYGVTVDDSDHIYFTGYTNSSNFQSKGFIIKLDSNGSFDSTFAEDGVWVSELPNTDEDFREIIIQPDQKILIAGETEILGEPEHATLIRLNQDGSLDTDFGTNGRASALVPNGYNPTFAALNNDGTIVTGGFVLESNNTNTLLAKFDQDGNIDLSFGLDGVHVDTYAIEEFARSIAIQADGKLLIGTGSNGSTGRDFGMTRYTQNGLLDIDFAEFGRVTTDILSVSNTAHSILIQEDGKIILSGFLGITPNHDYAIARYEANGDLDESFGFGGKVITDTGMDDLSFTSALQEDGKLLCAGNTKNNSGESSFSIARYFTKMETATNNIPVEIADFEIFPNPTNNLFTISYFLKKTTNVSIELLSPIGQHLKSLLKDEKINQGINTLEVDLSENFTAGIYFIKIQSSTGAQLKKLVLE
ncbi:MAG: T9SS type A sorting domain-containing protein [Bacteroidota bacterium]